jgi:hypothetical protein
MVEEAVAYVQGESLKATATLLREVYQLPDHQAGETIMAIGAERPGNQDEPKKRGCLFKIVIAIFVLPIGAAVLHRAFETPQERSQEDQRAGQQLANDDKRHWVAYSRAFAEVRMQKALKDPDSAQFRNITVEDQATFDPKVPGIACGEVNARNSFGGYTGYVDFMVVAGVPMEDGIKGFTRLWNKHCRKNQLG